VEYVNKKTSLIRGKIEEGCNYPRTANQPKVHWQNRVPEKQKRPLEAGVFATN
jgi:hypothetical protein